MVASKFLFDKGENELIYNDEWASIADLDTEDLNKIEREFLNALNWSCYVNQQTFMEQLVKFEALISANEIFKRSPNTMTYVELISIFKSNANISITDTNVNKSDCLLPSEAKSYFSLALEVSESFSSNTGTKRAFAFDEEDEGDGEGSNLMPPQFDIYRSRQLQKKPRT